MKVANHYELHTAKRLVVLAEPAHDVINSIEDIASDH